MQEPKMIGEMKSPVVNERTADTKLTVTPKAILEIKRLLQVEQLSSQSLLRVMVIRGGCSGLRYKLEFESKPPAEDDLFFAQDGVKVVVDPKALVLVTGTELDFSGGLNAAFLFNNPNAKSTCGCGTSFAV